MSSTYYELLTLLPGNLSDEEAVQAGENLRTYLDKHQATVMKHMLWERRRLAYPIKKMRQGVYVVTEFDMEPSRLAAFEKDLRLDKTVLRHQLIKAFRKSAKQLEQETRSRTAIADRAKPAKPSKPAAPAITGEELEEKIEEILTEDMTK